MPTPLFSVIVPTFRRPSFLEGCLGALASQRYSPERFEVIVVDDGGGSVPERAVMAWTGAMQVKLITQRHAGPATARNRGAAEARGGILAFTDDDCRPAPDWLRRLDALFAAEPGCAVAGKTMNVLGENAFSSASQLLTDYLCLHYNRHPRSAAFFTSNNLAMPADKFRELGGFDATWSLAAAEDRDLCDRCLGRGMTLVYAPEIVVYHQHPLGPVSFIRQHFNYGRGAYYFRRGLARRRGQTLKLEPLAFYSRLLSYPFVALQGRRAMAAAALLAASQIATIFGFACEALAGAEVPQTRGAGRSNEPAI